METPGSSNRIYILELFASLWLFCSFPCWALPAEEQDVVHAINAIAVDIYKSAASSSNNIIFSPTGIFSSWVMAYRGTRGDTSEQIRNVLHLPVENSRLIGALSDIHKLLSNINQAGNVKLDVANAIWIDRGHRLKRDYLETPGHSSYQPEIRTTNFADVPEEACQEINAWVAGLTQNQIKDFLPAESLSSLTRVVLANALYFKGKWARRFDTNATFTQDFWVNPEQFVSSKLMSLTEEFSTYADEQVQLLEMPYQGKELSFVVFLPRKVDGLSRLESELSSSKISQWSREMKPMKVFVSFPKLKLGLRLDLVRILSSLGIRDAFGAERADFSAMVEPDSSKGPLYISKSLQVAALRVDEDGSEASAGSALAGDLLGGDQNESPVVFRADHPFLFLIRENSTGAILFMGRVMNPSGETPQMATAEQVEARNQLAVSMIETPAPITRKEGVIRIGSKRYKVFLDGRMAPAD